MDAAASEPEIHKVVEGSPQMTEMNAQEKLLLKQLGQRFQLASEQKAAAIVWDAPVMRHVEPEVEKMSPASPVVSTSPVLPTSPVVSASPVVSSPTEKAATFYRLDFGFESPSVQQQMPEALRKRLENRLENRKETQKKSTGASVAAPAGRRRPEEVPPLALDSPPRRSSSIGGTRRSSREESLAVGANLAMTRRQGGSPTETKPKVKEKQEEGGRQMFDKNTLRMMNREVFKGAIGRYQQRLLQCLDGGALSARTPRRKAKSVQARHVCA